MPRIPGISHRVLRLLPSLARAGPGRSAMMRASGSRGRGLLGCLGGFRQVADGQLPAAGNAPADEEILLVALRALPGRQREALVLRCYADLPDAHVASAIGTSARSARTRIRRGMATLQAALDGRSAVAGRSRRPGRPRGRPARVSRWPALRRALNPD